MGTFTRVDGRRNKFELSDTENTNTKLPMDSNEMDLASIISTDRSVNVNDRASFELWSKVEDGTNNEGKHDLSKIFDEYFKKIDRPQCKCNDVQEKLEEMSTKIENLIRDVESNISSLTKRMDKVGAAPESKCCNDNEKLEEISENVDNNAKKIEKVIRNMQHQNSCVTRLLRMQDQMSKLNSNKYSDK